MLASGTGSSTLPFLATLSPNGGPSSPVPLDGDANAPHPLGPVNTLDDGMIACDRSCCMLRSRSIACDRIGMRDLESRTHTLQLHDSQAEETEIRA